MLKSWSEDKKRVTGFIAHLADYMYQIPTIAGTQIRINRLSDTNRLFFKMENDLTGDITISTDSGSTNKPLVDIDQNQITQLEKGFVEVVADADFFILRNRGISPADKQALIEIVNEAERNESDLKTQFINEVNTADDLINLPAEATWIDILLQISSINNGQKKYKIGRSQSTTPLMSYSTAQGSSINRAPLSVSGLGFTPSFIYIINSNLATEVTTSNVMVQHGNYHIVSTVQGSEGVSIRLAGNAYISDDGFSLPVRVGNIMYDWIAFE